MAGDGESYDGLMHAGAGTGLVLVQLAVIIPGLFPALALAGLIAAVVVLPVLVLGLAVTLLALPPYGLWRVATRGRRGRREAAAGPRTGTGAIGPGRGATPNIHSSNLTS